MMIGYGKLTREEQTAELDRFVPMINSWGICDSSCATCHFMKKDQEYWYGYLQKWLKSSREYEIRFGVVCLLDFFINEAYIDAVLEEMKKIHHDGYYVKMAVAWAVSICYIHSGRHRTAERKTVSMTGHITKQFRKSESRCGSAKKKKRC